MKTPERGLFFKKREDKAPAVHDVGQMKNIPYGQEAETLP